MRRAHSSIDSLLEMASVASERTVPIAHKQVLVVFSGLVLAMLLAALDSTTVSTVLGCIGRWVRRRT